MKYSVYTSVHDTQQAHGECCSNWLGSEHSFPDDFSGSWLENNWTWSETDTFEIAQSQIVCPKVGDGFSMDVHV